jgi:phosphonoacetate hydrolase
MNAPDPRSRADSANSLLTSIAENSQHSVRLEGIAERLEPNVFRYTTPVGSVTWERSGSGAGTQYNVRETVGTNLLSDAATDRILGLDHEQAIRSQLPAGSGEHGRPYAYDSLSQLFDDPKVPDALAVPAAGFPFHGNAGNHGALTSVQSRGICIAAGAGFSGEGWIAQHGRTIDITPTVLAAMFDMQEAHNDARDGSSISALTDPTSKRAKHAVVVVFDGCNVNLLDDVIAKGQASAVASLLARGTGLRHGIVSSFPTVTLPNHAAAFTGRHPGHNGVIHNEFLALDGRHINLLELEEMMHTCQWLREGTETIHEAVHRLLPDAFTTSIFEYIDRGADWSSFDQNRAGEQTRFPKEAHVASTASTEGWNHENVEAMRTYRFMTRLDEWVVNVAETQWDEAQSGHPLPTLQVVNFNVTDSAGHAVGPHFPMARAAIIDSDRRLQRVIDAITRAGVLNDTAIMLISDHGMEQCDLSLLEHPSADLSDVWSTAGRREVGDVLLYPV